ncbi:MAG: TetR/AcrR family transcriptional regulator [Saprospiraceae bacterium]|nr:TetR/AcrR family transcriptional regulator [Saprospiraceae bacterium]MCF8249307.1 TetR/AcrR family transcriptional regulator [Saprospiraceae bacterium]MCF8279728.1 TetR/AcrR family transcriptional regulator [Bacteroidales bacterium]MCF8311416.1 TetR/AcrR family transcriptional regulator [Saprospiraceae bacterium]MCF8439926.1 TetR/AcrR family transcriptional regulator [Saprospiraceae bacterium]
MGFKEEIITRSEQLFMRVGIKSVTMDDVSKELGISKKTLYQHFDNKDSLVEAVIDTHVEREQSCTEEIILGAKDALDEMIRIGVFLASTIEDVSPSTLFDLQKYYYKTWKTLMKKQDEHIINSVVQNIKKGIAEGNYRADINAEVIAKIYAKATYMIVDEITSPNSNYSRKEMIWELHNYHIHAIATPKGMKLWKKYNTEIKY